MNRRVIVWRTAWLPASETFIRRQFNSFSRWKPLALGLTAELSPNSSEHDVALWGSGRPSRLRWVVFNAIRRDRRLRRFLHACRADLIYAHFALDAVLVAPEARRARIPLVVVLHGYDIAALPRGNRLRARVFRVLLRRMFRQARAIVCVSGAIRELAILQGAQPEKCVVHHIGIDLLEPPSVASRSGILFVGRLVEKKGLEDLVLAFAKLGGVLRETQLTVIGDGPLRSQCERLANRVGVKMNFVGALHPEQVREAISRSILVCMPSKTAANGDREGLPTVAMEAAAAGTPVVAYEHSGIPEVVHHEKSGLLVPEGDVTELSAALRRLLLDEDLRESMGRSAVELAKNFDIERQTWLLEDIFEKIANDTAS